jgi:hypothetical protein
MVVFARDRVGVNSTHKRIVLRFPTPRVSEPLSQGGCQSRITAHSGKPGKVAVKCSRQARSENTGQARFRLAQRVGLALRNT